jgi:putative ABC transport system permease protein
MIRNYFKITIRNLKRRKAYSLINIGGLAAGLACCMVILMYVSNESSYDRYHKDADRLFRVLEYRKVPALGFCTARISAMVATVLKEYPDEVEQIGRVFPVRNALVKREGMAAFEDRVFYSESELFSVLTIPFLRGNPESALDGINNAVLTRRMALKYFGDEDPIGESISIKDPTWNRLNHKDQFTDYLVTGIAADPPSNTHFKYDIFLPLQQFSNTWILKEWHAGPTLTYLKLASGITAPEFEKEIEKIAYDFVNKELSAWGQKRRYFLQAVTDIHFRRDFNGLAIRDDLEAPGNRTYLYIYGMIALLILLIGCMNFVNLSNARSVYRIKEVGLRKVIGAGRWQLTRQFLSESIIITFLAALSAALLTNILLPFFNQFAGTTLRIEDSLKPPVFAAILGLVLAVGMISGLYPAFILTAFRPGQILRGSRMGTQGSFALKVLVVGQFAISIFLATGSLSVYKQLGYMSGQNLGFDKDYKYVLHLRDNAQIRNQVKTIKTEFLSYPGVLGAAASSSVPGRPMREGYLKWSDDKLDKPLHLTFLSCDDDFISQYEIGLVAGRTFNEKLNDEDQAFIINEAAVFHLGYSSPEEALGDRLHESYYGKWKTIVGVVENFHYQGLRHEVEPMYMEVSSSRYNMITVTLASENLPQTLQFLERKWSELFPGVPFDGFFLDDDFDRLYRKEAQMGKLLSILTGMGLVVACLGLLGLVSFLVQHRKKEIGIRKVLGASILSLTGLLSRQFVFLVFLANVISVPIAFLAITRWLQDFAFRIQLNGSIFAIAAAAALICAIVPVFLQAFRAAKADPVACLRYE